jgi:hypothetical protein
MLTLSERLDQHLIDLAWSLWTELGVAGVKRRHQKFLIAPEELILLTATLSEVDPRLRDEALDWCSRYHHFISISRLKALAKVFSKFVSHDLSVFSATLNSVSKAHWPNLTSAMPLKFKPSGKSKLPRLELPALLNLRLRTLFGVGARADLIAFFLTKKKADFSAADTTEIGYTKRNLSEILDDFVQAGIFDTFTVRNQQRYYFSKRDQMIQILSPLPEVILPWKNILEVLLPLRYALQQTSNKSESTKVVEIRNTLIELDNKLRKLNLTPPPLQPDFHAYLHSFAEWILEITKSLAHGEILEKKGSKSSFVINF